MMTMKLHVLLYVQYDTNPPSASNADQYWPTHFSEWTKTIDNVYGIIVCTWLPWLSSYPSTQVCFFANGLQQFSHSCLEIIGCASKGSIEDMNHPKRRAGKRRDAQRESFVKLFVFKLYLLSYNFLRYWALRSKLIIQNSNLDTCYEITWCGE